MTEQKRTDLQQEAEILARYLIRKKPTTKVVDLYVKAMQTVTLTYLPKDYTLLKLIIRKRFLLPYIDAGLGISVPNSVIRHKLLIMSAIVETQPQYASLFLNRKRSKLYWLVVGWVGLRSVGKAMVGWILLKLI
ncbi:MAG TPA: hypothetical protein DCS93_26190 [Microscillaceae bacterium]|nr:hypothetical protein [Microscillaceae bacterium]